MDNSSGSVGTKVLATTTSIPVWICVPSPSAEPTDEPFDIKLPRGNEGVTGANCVELTKGVGLPVKEGAFVATGVGASRLWSTVLAAMGGGEGMRGGAYPMGWRGRGSPGSTKGMLETLDIVS